VVEQLEVVRAREVHPVVDLERQPPPLPVPRGARESHQKIADDRVSPPRKRRPDEVVGGAVEKRDLGAAVAKELVGIAVAPVLFGARPEPQILDPDAPAVHELRDRPRLG
jgi:hypothetical protein